MNLTQEEQDMLSGKRGPGIQKCMEILVKVGEAFGAKRLVPIRSAHTMPKEPPTLLEEMTEGVTSLGVNICTQHALMSAFDPEKAEEMGLHPVFIENELKDYQKRDEIYKRLGFYPTNTCMPMLVGNVPLKDQHISWIGSGAQIFANSLLGARTNRDGVVMNLAAAITGRTPEMGLHLKENRYAQIVVTLDTEIDVNSLSDIDLGAIGYMVGKIAKNRNVVFDGLPNDMDLDHLKYLIAPLSTSGSVAICHIVGITPEASSLDEALGGNKPEESICINYSDIVKELSLFKLQEKKDIDLVILGCPHASIEELKFVSGLLYGKQIITGRRFWMGVPSQQYYLARKMGHVEGIEQAGGYLISSCMATVPDNPIPEGVKLVATNSFKVAHYVKALSKGNIKTVVLTLKDCIKSITV